MIQQAWYPDKFVARVSRVVGDCDHAHEDFFLGSSHFGLTTFHDRVGALGIHLGRTGQNLAFRVRLDKCILGLGTRIRSMWGFTGLASTPVIDLFCQRAPCVVALASLRHHFCLAATRNLVVIYYSRHTRHRVLQREPRFTPINLEVVGKRLLMPSKVHSVGPRSMPRSTLYNTCF